MVSTKPGEVTRERGQDGRSHSIRWRLTLSYATIACLAALALGTVLLGILRGYYAEKERDYLFSNAESFRALMSGAMAEDVPVGALRPQLENLAFFSKLRIRVLGAQGQELIDTGIPRNPYMISFIYAASDQSPDVLQVQTIQLGPPPGAFAGVDSHFAAAGGGGAAWQAGIGPNISFSRDEFVPFTQAIPDYLVGQHPGGTGWQPLRACVFRHSPRDGRCGDPGGIGDAAVEHSLRLFVEQ